MEYDDLKARIKEHEGYRDQVYKDSLGFDTVGIGRNLEHRGIAELEMAHMEKTMSEIYKDGITKEQAIDTKKAFLYEMLSKKLIAKKILIIKNDKKIKSFML